MGYNMPMFPQSKNVYISTTKDGYFGLEKLIISGKRIDEIITCPQTKSEAISDYADFSPLAKKYNLEIVFTKDINSLVSTFQKNKPNLIIVNGWSQLLKKELLELPLRGCVGTHPALLPKNRGRAPIAWHFINEEDYGGVTLFYLNEGSDSGPIIDQIKFKINANDNASTFYEKITQVGADLLIKNFDAICDGNAKSHKQDESGATYLLKRRPRDSEINFSANAKQIHNLVRAESNIYPLAFFASKGSKYEVLKSELVGPHPKYSGVDGQIAVVKGDGMWVLCGDGLISFTKVLDERRNPVNIREMFKEGDVLNE